MKDISGFQNLVARADQLIRLKATGTSKEFAAKLGISRASEVRLLRDLRNIGAPIKYCRYRKTYYYEYAVKLKFRSKY